MAGVVDNNNAERLVKIELDDPAGPRRSAEAEQENSNTSAQNYRLPTGITLQHCAKLAVVEDKPIMFDYWTASCDKEVLIGVRESGEKLLVKSEEEYTSPVSKIYKVE